MCSAAPVRGFSRRGAQGAEGRRAPDGHVLPLTTREFPRALGGNNKADAVRRENSFGGPTVYANPDRVFP